MQEPLKILGLVQQGSYLYSLKCYGVLQQYSDDCFFFVCLFGGVFKNFLIFYVFNIYVYITTPFH